MGMPHDFYLKDSKKNWNHICQNVPVKSSKFIATNILSYFNGELELSNSNFVKQYNENNTIDVGDKELDEDEW